MSEPLNYGAGAQHRFANRMLPVFDPSPDLWSRIVERHANVQRGARRRRLVALCSAALAGVAILIGAGALRRGTDIDWQARAQALELRLHALEPAPVPASGVAAEAQLVQLDTLLQAAYDNGADRNEVAALWKRRSELLDTLLRVRQQLDIHRT